MKFFQKEKIKQAGIYQIFNTKTNRIYIGQCKKFESRWSVHSRLLLNGKHHNKFLLNDFKKCKDEMQTDDFLEFHILEAVTPTVDLNLDEKESFWIQKVQKDGKMLYNLTKGGGGRPPISLEQKKRLSDSHKGKVPWNKGKRNYLSKETLQKMSDSHKGKPSSTKGRTLSEEERRKVSESKKGHKYNLGRYHSKETKQKISNSLKMRNAEIKLLRKDIER